MTWDEIVGEKARAGAIEVGLGASEDLIIRAEVTLGPLPPEYRLFLSRFGYASGGSNEVFGLGEGVPSYLDVVEMTLAERRDSPGFPAGGIVIFNDGGGNLYYMNSWVSGGDSPVLAWFHDEPDEVEIAAPSFSEWLLGQLP